MYKEFVNTSLFLCHHPALQDFAQRICSQADPLEQFSIVCERKEDLKTIRAQLFFELNKLGYFESGGVVAGVSMYTLDNLAQNFCASLSYSEEGVLRKDLQAYLQRPFQSIVTQEQLIKLLLLQFGYKENDSLPLAKQILTLIDVAWPADYSFFDLLLETQSLETTRTIHELTEQSLKKILGTFQAGTKVLSKFSRFQRLVLDYFENEFLYTLADFPPSDTRFVYPKRFLQSTILWISAPEYQQISHDGSASVPTKNATLPCYRPGNFQAYLVDIFRDRICRAQDILDVKRESFLNVRTVLSTNMHPSARLPKEHVTYSVAENKHALYHDLKTQLSNTTDELSQKKTLYLLADFDPGNFREITADASGSYAITDKEISFFFESYLPAKQSGATVDFSEDKSDALYQFCERLFALYEEFADLTNMQKASQGIVSETAQTYGLTFVDLSENTRELFYRMYSTDRLHVGEQNPVVHLDRALSFFALAELPDKLVSVGRPHAPTAPSFNVKVLNDAFFLLKRRGIPIDVLASDVSYRGFWSWLTKTELPLEFKVPHYKELEEFPEYLAPKGDANIIAPRDRRKVTYQSALEAHIQSGKFLIPDWASLYQWRTGNNNEPSLGITEFEDYVECPLQFFLTRILRLERDSLDFTQGNPLQTGTRAHKAAECLLSRLNFAFLGKGVRSALGVLQEFRQLLRTEALFLSPQKHVWQNAFAKCLVDMDSLTESQKQILNAGIIEICDVIFGAENATQNFSDKIDREVVKRTFRRFVETETDILETARFERVVSFLEHSLSFEFYGLLLTGRIDRVDLDADGFHILDYKTSKISKTARPIVLLPKEKNSKTQLSVQAALYSYGFVQKQNSEEEVERKVKSFSLYRLKSLDAERHSYLTTEYAEPLTRSSESYSILGEAYRSYAESLKQGNFAPHPVHEDVCTYCTFAKLCPVGNKKGSIQ